MSSQPDFDRLAIKHSAHSLPKCRLDCAPCRANVSIHRLARKTPKTDSVPKRKALTLVNSTNKYTQLQLVVWKLNPNKLFRKQTGTTDFVEIRASLVAKRVITYPGNETNFWQPIVGNKEGTGSFHHLAHSVLLVETKRNCFAASNQNAPKGCYYKQDTKMPIMQICSGCITRTAWPSETISKEGVHPYEYLKKI